MRIIIPAVLIFSIACAHTSETPMGRCIAEVQADPGVRNIAESKRIELAVLAREVCSEPAVLAEYEGGAQ